MSSDGSDFDPIGDPDKDLEDKFRRLEQEEELEAFKEQAGVKERFFIVLCPQCSGKNRVSVAKVRSKMPRCGRCKGELLT